MWFEPFRVRSDVRRLMVQTLFALSGSGIPLFTYSDSDSKPPPLAVLGLLHALVVAPHKHGYRMNSLRTKDFGLAVYMIGETVTLALLTADTR